MKGKIEINADSIFKLKKKKNIEKINDIISQIKTLTKIQRQCLLFFISFK